MDGKLRNVRIRGKMWGVTENKVWGKGVSTGNYECEDRTWWIGGDQQGSSCVRACVGKVLLVSS